MTIRVLETELRVLPMRTRMPFRYGIATLTALPHLFVRIDAEIDGARCTGVAADGLAPKWFTKHPATTTEDDIAEMVRVIEAACAFARAIGGAATVFDLWHQVYAAQEAWGADHGYPPLLWGFGASLTERALIDAFCRARRTAFAAAVRTNTLGIALSTLHPELEGIQPADLLPAQPRSTITVRHTVGLSDPLIDGEIGPDDQVDDGLPQSLVASIQAYGLTHFKIKLCGDPARDSARLRRIADVLATESHAYAVTLDGNEQFHDVEDFRTLWQSLLQDRALTPLMRRVLFVEQPLHRDVALSAATTHGLAAWPDRPPIIIDESDGAIESLPAALACGYAGASHKNCKGVFKGIANACLIARRQHDDPGWRYILSGEDLANVGPVALLQDLAVMATLGIDHVERNGHHYFAGLRMFPADVQDCMLAHHGDLYRRHARGFATLDIRGGTVALESVVAAPFGLRCAFDTGRYTPLANSGIATPS